MAERYEFAVSYDDDVMREAIRRYLFRLLFVSHTMQSTAFYFGLLMTASALIFFRAPTFEAGLVWGAVAALAAMLAAYVYLGWRDALASLADMKQRSVTFRLGDEDMTIESERGAVVVDWRSIAEIVRGKRYWILGRGRRQAILLPLEGVPSAALDFIAARTKADV